MVLPTAPVVFVLQFGRGGEAAETARVLSSLELPTYERTFEQLLSNLPSHGPFSTLLSQTELSKNLTSASKCRRFTRTGPLADGISSNNQDPVVRRRIVQWFAPRFQGRSTAPFIRPKVDKQYAIGGVVDQVPHFAAQAHPFARRQGATKQGVL